MPIYDYVCSNPKCPVGSILERQKKDHQFEHSTSVANRNIMPRCPLCQSDEFVKREQCYSFPRSKSWEVK
jgi:hypothetical protein